MSRARDTAEVAEEIDLKVDYSTPVNEQTGTSYTFELADARKLTTASSASAVTLTIPPQSEVTWEDNTILRVINYGAGAVTVAGGSGVTVTNTATTINQNAAGAAIRTGSDAWTLIPFGESPFSATGGNEVVTVDSYRYHLFTSSSNFVVGGSSGDVEIAVIGAGGGGGSFGGGGGGGAKEPSSGYTTQTLSPGNYSVTIAAGGAGASSYSVRGTTPSDTSFAGTSTISAEGGGGGGSGGSGLGGDTGGSGGGGGRFVNAGGGASGSNTNIGGNGTGSAPNYGNGGGGGATGVGGNGLSTGGGSGGQGLLLTTIDSNLTSANFTTFSGMTRVCSGGGGGSEGGSTGTGGTGAGNGTTNSSTGGSATSFGSGGGGGGYDGSTSLGGSGYQGIVIVRYQV